MAVSVYVRQVFVDVLTKGVAAIHTLADVSIFCIICIFVYLHICIFAYLYIFAFVLVPSRVLLM